MDATHDSSAQRPSFIYPSGSPPESSVAAAVNPRYLADETTLVRELAEIARVDDATKQRVDQTVNFTWGRGSPDARTAKRSSRSWQPRPMS